MKIRIGYVTNSSSTNFIIMSKEELSVDYLYDKLGFKKDSIIKSQARELCENIINGTYDGVRYLDWDCINYDAIKETFGVTTAEKYKKKSKKKYHIYVGRTESEGALTGFFTTDSFEFDCKGFYINARNSI